MVLVVFTTAREEGEILGRVLEGSGLPLEPIFEAALGEGILKQKDKTGQVLWASARELLAYLSSLLG